MFASKVAGSLLALPFSAGAGPAIMEKLMLGWALAFLVVAIVAGLLGFNGIAGAATNIAWILLVAGLVVALVLFLKGSRPRV